MFQINLPPYPTNVTRTQGRLLIFDILRRRYVRLTPEEWVRQHFIHYLTGHKGYPAALMGSEVTLTLNGMTRRCDAVLFGRDGHPRMLLEFKAPNIAVTQAVFTQICAYNQTMRVPWLIVSNGLNHYCCHIRTADEGSQPYRFLTDIPSYDQLEET